MKDNAIFIFFIMAIFLGSLVSGAQATPTTDLTEVKNVKKSDLPSESSAPVSVGGTGPVPHSGPPGTYKIVVPTVGPYAGELALDLGFSNYARLANEVPDITPYAEGQVITFSEETGEVLDSNESELDTYRAWIHQVLSGDTIGAVVDLGFGFTTMQILRLRGVNAPDSKSAEGAKAKEFLESVFADHGGAKQPVFVKVSRSEERDRYLADVFITEKNGEEQYLNNRLLEKGYVVKAKE